MKLFWIALMFGLTIAPAVAQTSVPDLRGTWKGTSESIVWGAGNLHHEPRALSEPARLDKVSFTMKIGMQTGRLFSATFTSARGSQLIVGAISREGSIYIAANNGTDRARLLGPNRMEMCHLTAGPNVRIASCTVFTRPS